MACKTSKLILLASGLLLPALAAAQTPAAPDPHDMQSMPGMPVDAVSAKPKPHPQPQSQAAPLKLADLEQMALSRNPTMLQATANLRAAEGARQQAGLYPNPTLGYYGDEIRGGSYRSGKQGGYISQTIVLGGKRGAAERTAEQGRLLALTGIDAQRYRVLTGVRTLYYQALAAQRMVSLRRQLLALAQDAVQTSHQLGNVGQADRPDVLQAEVESEQAHIDLETALQNQKAVWQALAAVVGNPGLPAQQLEGDLEAVPQLDEQEWVSRILADSPQVKAARQSAERAKTSLSEAKRDAIPDLQISANLSQDNEPLDNPASRVGLVGGAQVGIQLPIFNRNQGNIETAKAGVQRGQQEVLRTELELRRQMSSLFRDYAVARTSADLYRTSMLPRAQKAYDLYKASYENMAAAYPQVLIAQRTLFQLQADYIHALEDVWVNATAIQGFGLADGLAAP